MRLFTTQTETRTYYKRETYIDVSICSYSYILTQTPTNARYNIKAEREEGA